MTLVRWNPVSELAAMEVDRLNRMFEGVWGGSGAGWIPPVDIYETDDHNVVLEVELPDMKREDISLTVENGVLTLGGERRTDQEVKRDRFHRRERCQGEFCRSFSLPDTLDASKVTANYADGVLTIRLPQREEAQPKQVAIEVR